MRAGGGGSLPPTEYHVGGACTLYSLVDCTVRETAWHFLPSGWVRVARTEAGFCGECAQNKSAEGAPLARVATTQAFSHVGCCACSQTPSGRCSCQDYVSLGVDDGEHLYGSASKGSAKLLLDDFSERTAGENLDYQFVVNSAEDCLDCAGAAMELTVSKSRVTIVKHNQAPCIRHVSGSCCLGVCVARREGGGSSPRGWGGGGCVRPALHPTSLLF